MGQHIRIIDNTTHCFHTENFLITISEQMQLARLLDEAPKNMLTQTILHATYLLIKLLANSAYYSMTNVSDPRYVHVQTGSIMSGDKGINIYEQYGISLWLKEWRNYIIKFRKIEPYDNLIQFLDTSELENFNMEVFREQYPTYVRAYIPKEKRRKQ